MTMRLIRMSAVAVGAALTFAAGAPHAQPLRHSTMEPGVYIEFGPSFLDFRDIDSAERCWDLCRKNPRCRVWRYVTGRAPADYGTARRLCVLGDRRPLRRTRPGGWAISGQVN
jgi:hypothetical protein